MAEYEVSDRQMEQIDAAIATVAAEDLAAAGEGTPLHRLNLAAGLLGLLDATNLGPYHDKGLEAVDRDAYEVLSLRRSRLDAEVVRLSETPELMRWFADIRARGLTRALGPSYAAAVAGYEAFLSGPTFWARISALETEARKLAVQRALRKLAVLDPEASQRAGLVLAFRQLLHDPVEWFAKQTAAVRERGWDGFFLLIGEAAKAVNVNDPTAAEIIGDLKTGAKGAKGLKAVGEKLADPQWRNKIARLFQRNGLHRSFFGAVENGNLVGLLGDNEDTTRITIGMRLVKHLGWFGPAFKIATALPTLAGLFTAWPPMRPGGGIDWEAAFGMSAATLSLTSTTADLAGDIAERLSKRAMQEVADDAVDVAKTVAQQITAADGSVSLTRMQKLHRFIKVGGLIGDAIFVGINIAAMVKEVRNEDPIGAWMLSGAVGAGVIGVVGGAMALSAALAPVAAVPVLLAIVFGAVFAVGGFFFGESDLAGLVRQKLTALGITDFEKTALADLTVHTYTVCAPLRPSSCYEVEEGRSGAEIRRFVAAAPTAEKVAFINQRLDRRTGPRHKQQVFDAIVDARETPDFLALLEALDMGRVAAELSNESKAATVMRLAARAYDAAGRKPGPAFTDQLKRHCVDRREGVLNRFLADIVDSGAGPEQLNVAVWWNVDPSVLLEATRAYLPRPINAPESDALVDLLLRASSEQLNALVEQGGVDLTTQLHRCLRQDAWSRLVARLGNQHASDRAREVALAPHVHEAKTVTWSSNNRFVRHSAEQVIENTLRARRHDKHALVSGFLDQPMLDYRNMVHALLAAIPIEGGDFRYVVENIYALRLKDALRDDDHAAEILRKTLDAYLADGVAPGPAFYAQLDAYCRYQRAGVMERFIEDVPVASYMMIDARKLVEGSLMLEYRGLQRRERRLAYAMLQKAHPTLFGQMVEIGGAPYVDLVKSSLSPEDRAALEDRIGPATQPRPF